MSDIRDDARQEAERRWPSPNTGLYEGLTEVGGFRGERHDATDNGSVAPPSDTDLVSVSWFDCDCGFSKPCAESHLKRARVPRALLAAQEVRHVS